MLKLADLLAELSGCCTFELDDMDPMLGSRTGGGTCAPLFDPLVMLPPIMPGTAGGMIRGGSDRARFCMGSSTACDACGSAICAEPAEARRYASRRYLRCLGLLRASAASKAGAQGYCQCCIDIAVLQSVLLYHDDNARGSHLPCRRS